MNYVFVVHAEKMFDHLMDEDFHYNLAKTVFTQDAEKIIVFCSEVEATGNDDGLIPFASALVKNGAEYVQWGWGYEDAMYDEDDQDKKWLIESFGHEYTWIPEEIRNLKPSDFIYLCGGAVGECLADMESILDSLAVPYQKCAVY